MIMNKKELLEKLIAEGPQPDTVLFYPILMHFAARFHGSLLHLKRAGVLFFPVVVR
jgi:hypothetical protein